MGRVSMGMHGSRREGMLIRGGKKLIQIQAIRDGGHIIRREVSARAVQVRIAARQLLERLR